MGRTGQVTLLQQNDTHAYHVVPAAFSRVVSEVTVAQRGERGLRGYQIVRTTLLSWMRRSEVTSAIPSHSAESGTRGR